MAKSKPKAAKKPIKQTALTWPTDLLPNSAKKAVKKTPAERKTSAANRAATPKKEPKASDKVVPRLLKQGHDMTEKKLRLVTDKKGYSYFLLAYTLDYLLDTDNARKEVHQDVHLRAVPDGFHAEEVHLSIHDLSPKMAGVVVLVKAKITRHDNRSFPVPGVDPAHAPVELPKSGEAITPADIATMKKVAADPTHPLSGIADATLAAVEALGVAQGDLASEAANHPVKAVIREDDLEPSDDSEPVTFDAAPWLAQAADETILHAARDGYSADKAVYFCEMLDGDQYAKVADFREEHDVAWECKLDEAQALEWVEKFRPHLLPALAEIKDKAAAVS